MTDITDLQAWQRVVGAMPDGHPGPQTFERTVAWFRAHGYIDPPATTGTKRQAVVDEALAHLGPWTEQQVDDLWREVGCPQMVGHWHDKAWCGAYALRCLRRALGVDWTWHDGKGFLEVYALKHVALPEPGDIAYFAREQHHAIVERPDGHGNVLLTNGNALIAPAEGVNSTIRRISDVATFYSIGSIA